MKEFKSQSYFPAPFFPGRILPSFQHRHARRHPARRAVVQRPLLAHQRLQRLPPSRISRSVPFHFKPLLNFFLQALNFFFSVEVIGESGDRVSILTPSGQSHVINCSGPSIEQEVRNSFSHFSEVFSHFKPLFRTLHHRFTRAGHITQYVRKIFFSDCDALDGAVG